MACTGPQHPISQPRMVHPTLALRRQREPQGEGPLPAQVGLSQEKGVRTATSGGSQRSQHEAENQRAATASSAGLLGAAPPRRAPSPQPPERTHFWKQWAAESTQKASMRVAPQMWRPRYNRLACHGHRCLGESLPPKIL